MIHEIFEGSPLTILQIVINEVNCADLRKTEMPRPNDKDWIPESNYLIEGLLFTSHDSLPFLFNRVKLYFLSLVTERFN